MTFTDDQLSNWTKPAFGNEEEKAEETKKFIKEAIDSHKLLRDLPIAVYAKGSYKNNTNVRRESDIDIAVEYRRMIQLDYAQGLNFSHTGLEVYSGSFRISGILAYKMAVGEALRDAFGQKSIDASGNRVFKVREGSKLLQADVIPCTTYRFYTPSGFYEGIELILNIPDGNRHFNYPHYHYRYGVSKNSDTAKRYKNAVRILKNMEGVLSSAGNAKPVPSYLIECLAFNVPKATYLTMTSWRELLKNICAVIYKYTAEPEPQNELDRWHEVNSQKFLFHPQQGWERVDANIFAQRIFGALTS